MIMIDSWDLSIVAGMISMVWFVLWMIFVSDSPAQHRRIAPAERAYIAYALKDSAKRDENKVPSYIL